VLGQARRIVVDKDTTTIIDGAGDQSAIDDRIRQIRPRSRPRTRTGTGEAPGAPGQAGRRRRRPRAGAATEVELKEKKHRLEDAISATRAAIEEGIIPGGGSALVQLAAELGDLGMTGDEAVGVQVVRRALSAPCAVDRRERRRRGRRGVATVAGLKPGHGHGYNAADRRVRLT
jgi:chaperonin GroEL